jgi:hypothetical protein
MTKVFISYRRDDSGGYSRAIYQHLVQQFGTNAVFMDLETLKPGRDFADEIKHTLAESRLMLVLIGKDWMGPKADGTYRINDPKDFVRLEVALGLQQDILVIPILLANASMPNEAELPDDIKALLLHNAVQVTHPRFTADMEGVLSVTAEALGVASGWGRFQRRLFSYVRWLRTPPGLYWALTASYGVFAIWSFSGVMPEAAWIAFSGLEEVKKVTFGDSLWLRLTDWTPSFDNLLRDPPVIVFLILILVPVLHRYKDHGLVRGLIAGVWVHLSWQLFVVSFVVLRFNMSFDYAQNGSHHPWYWMEGISYLWISAVGFLLLVLLIAARRFCLRAMSSQPMAE